MISGESVYGFAVSSGSWVLAEHLGRSGADFLLLDGQHGSFGSDAMATALLAISAGGAVPMARPARNDYTMIAKLLDEGALGIVVPMVDIPEQAQEAANACRFPPDGTRSHGWSGAARLGDDYVAGIGAELFVAVQIESARAVENAEAIMATPGIDGCWIGPADLSLSLGISYADSAENEQFQRGLEQVVVACRNTGKIPGFASFEPESAIRAREMGFRFLTAGWDVGFVNSGVRAALRYLRA
jgi:4-hydroxy-2-oxoheptanedioate aldolase